MTFSVRPVIVFPGWYFEKRPAHLRDIWVLEPKAPPAFLDREPDQLKPEDISVAYFHLSRSGRAVERERQPT